MSVSENIKLLKSTLPKSVSLVAVSKFHPAEMILEAYNAGQRIFGESRVQELTTKQTALPQDIEWHFIGTLQTNKVKYIAPYISMIQSVDTLRLLQEIDNQANKNLRKIRVLIEVHIAEEASKHGFSIEECRELFRNDTLKNYHNIEVCGLMGMATFTENTEQIHREFKKLRSLFDEIKSSGKVDTTKFRELSTGMSDDYPIAIEEGSTMVRIGTKIFGVRQY